MTIKQMYVAMIFSRDNILVLLFAATLIFDFGCTQKKQEEGKDALVKGFVNSKVFKDHLNNYDDKESVSYSETRFFNLINEESFLDCEHYDFYIVYLYKAPRDTMFDVYVVRSKGGIAVSSLKRFNQRFPFYFIKKGNKEPTGRFNIAVSSKIITTEETDKIKKTLDEATKTVKDRFPKNDLPTRTVYYYDGRDYYGLSDYKIATEAMDEIDRLLRSANLFK